jgi:hypothetical protein
VWDAFGHGHVWQRAAVLLERVALKVLGLQLKRLALKVLGLQLKLSRVNSISYYWDKMKCWPTLDELLDWDLHDNGHMCNI